VANLPSGRSSVIALVPPAAPLRITLAVSHIERRLRRSSSTFEREPLLARRLDHQDRLTRANILSQRKADILPDTAPFYMILCRLLI